MNMQRNAIYKMRRQILDGKDIERNILDMLGDVVSVILDSNVPEGVKPSDWNLAGLNTALMEQFGFQLDTIQLNSSEKISEAIKERVQKIYTHQKSSMGPYFEQISKMIMLNSIDQRWKEHLYTIDKVKEGINLRAYGQKDPLIEYKKEAFKAFEQLNNVIKSETLEQIMRVQLVAEGAEQALQNLRPEETDMDELDYSDPTQVESGFSQLSQGAGQAVESNGPQKRRIVTGPPQRQSDRPQNRSERRKNK
jgi:preprotein translocase subunit SecA